MSLLRLLTMMRGASLAPVFRASAQVHGASGVAARPAGIAVGDLVVVLRVYGSSTASALQTAGGAVWSQAAAGTGGTGTATDTFYRVLDATDVANAWNFSVAGPSLSLVFTANGATTLTFKDTMTDSTTSPTITSGGYVASGAARAMISVATDESLTIPVPPAGSTTLASIIETVQAAALAMNPIYRTGVVTWSGFGTSGNTKKLWLFEVT